ncbi:MAG TPA: NUDIX domain-containing protein [Burkholderiaceae bacterium]|jgi:bifunctional NMN adenylyltransferase/nudix hydrolase|nr:NUDIX domain-containing protein [Burkholderiaceae bacterium]
MNFDAAVLVGRFEPFHQAHAALLREALLLAPQVVVVIGSAHQARTPKNPFTWTERAEMIRLAAPEGERERLHFVPVRDYYDEARWVRAVRAGVEQTLAALQSSPGTPRVVIAGHVKDATSGYLRAFPFWPFHAVERFEGADGSQIRDALFSATQFDARDFKSRDAALEAVFAALVDQVPPSTLDFLRAWVALPFHDRLTEEWRALRDYHDAWKGTPFPPVFVTVDAVVRCAGHVLLIERGHAPGRGLLATPGGFIESTETCWQSCLRELREETRLAFLEPTLRDCLRAVTVFDHPYRSQRGRTITHAHFFDLGERELPEVAAGDDAAAVQWVPIAELPAMEDRFHDDHFHMLDHFLGLTLDEHG